MAVDRRLAGYSGMRIDWPHLRSIESSVSHDFDMVGRGLITGLGRPYLIRGFRLKIPSSATNAANLQVEVADSCVLHSSATESGTILQVAAGTPDESLNSQNPHVIGAFQSNAINYVSLDYRRVTDTATVDQTAGWSPSQQLEFQRAVPIGRILQYRFIISTIGYSTNLPLYAVKTTINGAVEYIVKGVTDLFRLGTGGANPNPQNSYTWGNLENPQSPSEPRREWISPTLGDNPLTVRPGDNPLAFDYGDFAIKNLKDWMDAVMTRIKEITNSEYWYIGSSVNNANLGDLSFDAINSVITGMGSLSYNLVLESSAPSDGAFQSVFTDPTIQPGDVYVEGVTSGTRATMTSFNQSRMLINSMTTAGFIFGEELWTRRRFRPDASLFKTIDYTFGTARYASLYRAANGTTPGNLLSWTYVNHASPTGLVGWTIATVTTTAPHGFNVGQFVSVKGLLSASPMPPDGTHRVLAVPTTSSFMIATNFPQSGAATVLGTNGAVVSGPQRHPYSGLLAATDFQPGSGNTGLVTVPGHSFLPAQVFLGDYSSGSRIIDNVSAPSIANLRIGMLVISANLTGGQGYITRLNSSLGEVEVDSAATATVVASSTTAKQLAFISGLQATGHTTNQLDGVHAVESLGPSNELVVDFGFPVTGTAVTGSATAEYLYHSFQMSLSGATPLQFNQINALSFAITGESVQFPIGEDILPVLGFASGPLVYDGVVADSTVTDPVRVSTITNDGAGNLTITTLAPHGLITSGPLDFTIFGDSTLSIYIRSYHNVNIVNVSTNVFQLNGTGIISGDSYTNGGADNTFVRFADNPYAGPIQWDSDIVIKGIMGDLRYTIPQTAVVDMSDPEVSPTANQFNVNGQTGTAYLQDGEVLYIKLKRNGVISNGTVFTTMGDGAIIPTSSIMTDENGDPLVAGDFIKFSDETDSYWLRIATINPTAVQLVDDRGQPPSIDHRPAKTGKMTYARGTYNLVYVKKHYLVEADASTYWLAVRRDNNGPRSKVYFRSLELEAGEVRQINDNQTTNLLTYTGALTEGAVNPNYTLIDQIGDYQATQPLTVDAVDNLTRMVTFSQAPSQGFQINDQVIYFDGAQYHYFITRHVVSSRTVIMDANTSILSAGQNVTYVRVNRFIQDQDNLTLAIRKEDRSLGVVDTAINRPVYDESIYIQQVNLGGAGTVRSGSYVYKGPLSNPTALAWVVHGNAAVTETIEDSLITMPGGHITVGASAILVNIVYGSFLDGDGLFQNGSATGRTVNNPGNPPFTAPPVYGDTSAGGVEIVLPPNKRTQIKSPSGFVVYGTHSFYKQSIDPTLTGEELLVIVNDGVREANYDYSETFGGPKAKIRFIRTTPPNTRMRFRAMSTFGSSVVSSSSDVTLQSAYNAGNTIQTTASRPVTITSDNVNAGSAGLVNRGSLLMNGGASQLGGIFNEISDQSFVIGRENNKPKEAWTGLEAVKTHSSHPGSAKLTKTSAQVVTGAVGTVIAGSEVTLVDLYSYRIKMTATARRSDGTFGVASFTLEGTFYRNGGAAAAAGNPVSVINGVDGDGNNFAAAFGLSGNDVVLVVFGTAGSTIQWACTTEWQGVGVA